MILMPRFRIKDVLYSTIIEEFVWIFKPVITDIKEHSWGIKTEKRDFCRLKPQQISGLRVVCRSNEITIKKDGGKDEKSELGL